MLPVARGACAHETKPQLSTFSLADPGTAGPFPDYKWWRSCANHGMLLPPLGGVAPLRE